MAISEVHYRLLQQLRDEGKLPQQCDILEIGEANWYGDFQPDALAESNGHKLDDREMVRHIYATLIDPASIVSIDPGGGPDAIKHDLNQPIDLEKQFGLVINHGTAEHIFNAANVFNVMHDHCETGGLMIHESPWRGWPDHGFYSFQPTLFWDVARANNYRIDLFCGEDITNKKIIRFESREQLLRDVKTLPENLTLFVALRKLFDKPFEIPQQGVYTMFASQEVRQAWMDLR